MQSNDNQIQLLMKKLAREKQSRHEAEDILENKSRELYFANLYLNERYEISKILAETKVLADVVPIILKIICRAIQLQVANFWIVDPRNQVLRNICSWNDELPTNIAIFMAESKKLVFAEGIGLPGWVWENKSVLFIPDVCVYDNFQRKNSAKLADLHAAFGIPILFENEILGILEFYTSETYTASEAKSKFLLDVGRQMGVSIAREETENRIKAISRRAGMAEIASSVLHNIGNILNSVKVSLGVLRETIAKSNIPNYVKVSQLLQDNIAHIDTFLSQDPKGKILPNYLIALADSIAEEYQQISQECKGLINYTEQIEDILISQQSIGGIAIIMEQLSVAELIDSAINMCFNNISAKQIDIHKDYKDYPVIFSDKSKLIQILVNLIQNAKDALFDADCTTDLKKIFIQIKKERSKNEELIKITIQDNGVGIIQKNLIRIFSFGFTTKTKGHGFGLHGSALFAKELGGSLTAYSKGKDRGATFILTLPEKTSDAFVS